MQGSAALPPPHAIVVTDFTLAPEQIRLDTSPGASLRRALHGETLDQAVEGAAHATQQALAERLTERLQAMGLSVTHLPAAAVPPPGTLLVQGQFVSVNEGNRTRRMLIGFGAGKSSVTADAQLYYLADPRTPQFLRAFEGSADSGHMPGAAATMGAGAAAQAGAEAAALSAGARAISEKYGSGDAANAIKLADALADQIGAFAAEQGWIAPSPAP